MAETSEYSGKYHYLSNRVPATLVMLSVDAQGQLIINEDWAQAVDAPF
ncbi:MAG: hypothetical protein ACR2IE_06640 [Candidatus Sumerlaeaceae bacterium]